MVTILNASTLEQWARQGDDGQAKVSARFNTLLRRRETPLSPTTISRSFLAIFRKYQYTYPVSDVSGVRFPP